MMREQPVKMSREKQSIQKWIAARLEHMDKANQVKLRWTKGSSDEGGHGGMQGRAWDSLKWCWEATATCSQETTALGLHCTSLASVCIRKGMHSKAEGRVMRPLWSLGSQWQWRWSFSDRGRHGDRDKESPRSHCFFRIWVSCKDKIQNIPLDSFLHPLPYLNC